MIELSDTAHEQLEKYFADKEASPIRIYLASGG
jgi:Fe-S cluster assembly iron-binding protein IscA